MRQYSIIQYHIAWLEVLRQVQTQTHFYIHIIYIYIYLHAYIHTYIPMYISTLAHMHTSIHTHIHRYIHGRNVWGLLCKVQSEQSFCGFTSPHQDLAHSALIMRTLKKWKRGYSRGPRYANGREKAEAGFRRCCLICPGEVFEGVMILGILCISITPKPCQVRSDCWVVSTVLSMPCRRWTSVGDTGAGIFPESFLRVPQYV